MVISTSTVDQIQLCGFVMDTTFRLIFHILADQEVLIRSDEKIVYLRVALYLKPFLYLYVSLKTFRIIALQSNAKSNGL